jgi:hypothetical protein
MADDKVEVPDMIKHPLKDPSKRDVVSLPAGSPGAGVHEIHEESHGAAENMHEKGLYLYGVVRARAWRGRERRRDGAVQRVRYRDLEALVREVPFVLPQDTGRAVDEHQRTVEMVMRRTTVLPSPFGIVFRGRRQLIKMMQDQYLVLDEGLSLLEGHWELRLHIMATGAVGEVEDSLSNLAMEIYAELRRFARAAVPFPSDGRRLVSAAFLVDRTTWVEFIERIEDFDSQHGELGFDVTGPWPPYDFVRVVV